MGRGEEEGGEKIQGEEARFGARFGSAIRAAVQCSERHVTPCILWGQAVADFSPFLGTTGIVSTS